ncbi:MAG: DNA adenine methylase, partial [Candidatus Hodarchaeota archaeon]
MNSIIQEKKLQVLTSFERFPRMRFMGNKYKLLPWLRDVFMSLDFEKVLDPFSGSGSVSYLLKCLDKQVFSSDFLNFPVVIS